MPQHGRLRLEHVDRGAERRPERGSSVAWPPAAATLARTRPERAHRRRRAAPPRSGRRPNRRAPRRSALFDQRAADLGAAGRRRRDAPDAPFVPRAGGHPAAVEWGSRSPRMARRRAPHAKTSAKLLHRACRARRKALASSSSTLLRCATEGATPSSRKAVTAAPRRSRFRQCGCGARRGRCAAADDIRKGAHDRRHDLAGGRIVKAEHQNGLARSRPAAAS